MNLKKILIGLGLLLLLIFGLSLFSIYRGFGKGKRIEVAKLDRADHALFQGPKNEDGSVDYMKAINRIYGEEVADEDNFAVVIFEVAADSSQLNPTTRAKYRSRLKFNENSEYRLRMLTDFPELEKFKGEENLDRQSAFSFDSGENGSTQEQQEQQEALVKYVAQQSKCLDYLVQQLDLRKKYFVPVVPDILEPESLIAVKLPHADYSRDLARQLLARSSQGVADANMLAAWRDVRATFQLAERCSQGSTSVEYFESIIIRQFAVEQTVQILNSSDLNQEQAKLIAQQLPELLGVVDWTKSLDNGERALMLNTIDQVVSQKMKAIEDLVGGNSDLRMPAGWIDSVALADEANALIDEIIAAAQEKNLDSSEAAFAQAENRLLQDSFDGRQLATGMAKILGGMAPKAEITEATSKIVFGLFFPGFRQAEHVNRRTQALGNLLQLGVAVRRFQIANNRMPTDLQEIQDLAPAEVFIDPFTKGQLKLVVQADRTVRIYSVGENKRNDSGVQNSEGRNCDDWRINILPLQAETQKEVAAEAN